VAPGASSSATAAPASSVEIVPSKPGEGLKRGKFEAPAWAFWVALAAILVVSTLYLLRRLGVLRIKRNAAK
jgi:hypothetical protein